MPIDNVDTIELRNLPASLIVDALEQIPNDVQLTGEEILAWVNQYCYGGSEWADRFTV